MSDPNDTLPPSAPSLADVLRAVLDSRDEVMRAQAEGHQALGSRIDSLALRIESLERGQGEFDALAAQVARVIHIVEALTSSHLDLRRRVESVELSLAAAVKTQCDTEAAEAMRELSASLRALAQPLADILRAYMPPTEAK